MGAGPPRPGPDSTDIPPPHKQSRRSTISPGKWGTLTTAVALIPSVAQTSKPNRQPATTASATLASTTIRLHKDPEWINQVYVTEDGTYLAGKVQGELHLYSSDFLDCSARL